MEEYNTCCLFDKLKNYPKRFRNAFDCEFTDNTVKTTSNCICVSSIYSSKPKWKLKFRFEFTKFAMRSVALLLFFISLTVTQAVSDIDSCLRGKFLSRFALIGGKNARTYNRLGLVDSAADCARQCCRRARCDMALVLKGSCFEVICKDKKYCKPLGSRKVRYNAVLFIRPKKSRKTFPKDFGVTFGDEMTGNTNDKSCNYYNGKHCAFYLDKRKTYYFNQHLLTSVEGHLNEVLERLLPSLSITCINPASKLLCNQWFPQCSDVRYPKPTQVCKSDCLLLQQTFCKKEYSLAGDDDIRRLLPSCAELTDNKDCVRLNFEVKTDEKYKIDAKRIAEPEPKNDKKTFGKKMATPTSRSSTIVVSTVALSTALSPSVGRSSKPTKSSSTVPVVTLLKKGATEGNTDTDEGSSAEQNASNRTTPLLVPVTNSAEGTNFSEEDKKKKVSSTPKVIVPTTSPISSIKVSAGENKVITLPENKVSLYASTWPKPAKGIVYKYKWMQITAPEKSQGYMEGKDTSRLTLTMLDVPGVYQFKVDVTSKHAKGEGYVNVTVKPVPRVNRPPRADIQPREQTVTLPVKSVVLSGSKSTDDDKIVSYKWEEVKGPIANHGKTVMVGDDKEVVQIRNLSPGVYTFRLTVVDSDSEQDHTDATITVKEEKDYPPVARAGDGVVLTLPENHVTLYGNGSTDDKKIVKYEWTKTPDSPTTGDTMGSNKAILKVSNLVVGHYTFVLHVTDAAGQTSESKVTVVVQPEKNAAPVAIAGPDKDLVYPDDSTTLDASRSKDDQHDLQFYWEKISGPDGVTLSDVKKPKLYLSGLKEGRYSFKVTVTDGKGLSASDTVSVNVKKDQNEPPVSKAGPDQTVILPNRAVVLDGSQSSDDQMITSYEWTRDGKSPAAGDILNNSNHQPVLRLANLVEGVYTFTLTVADNKGLKGTDNAVVLVRQDDTSLYLVELYIEVDITHFTEESKRQLLRKLSVILNVEDGDVVVQELKRAAFGTGLMMVFYVRDPNLNRKLDGQVVANILKQKVGYHGTLFEYKMLKVEPFVCRNNCSGHGYCDKNTKLCVCDGFWMQDIFRAWFGARETNCDWSILYVTVIAFGIIVAVVALTWAFCFMYARRRKARRRLRYIPVHDDDDDTKEEIMMIPKGKYFAHSLTFTESDEDSEEETTVFDKKVVSNGPYPNGSANGLVPRKSHPT